MKALTVKQPWAWAIIHGGKDVENRTQNFTYRGPLAIHAAKVDDDGGYGDARMLLLVRREVSPLSRLLRGALSRGAVIGVVDVVGCHWAANHTRRDWCSRWAEDDATHLMLRNPRPLAIPVPARGMPGMFDLPDDVAAAVQRQLGGDS